MDKIEHNTNIRSVESRRGKILWAKTAHRDASEFTDMRYTAVDCAQPIEFDKHGYKIRCGENGRVIKVYVVVTMYAEDDQELDSTLRGVCENVKSFPEYKDISVSWQEVAVAIVSDGRQKANKKTLEFASSIGIYDVDLMNKYGNPGQKGWTATWDTYMHMFEYSVQFKEDSNFEKCYPPLQCNFAVKERNGGKLSSHLWYFNAFSNHLNPKYCYLLDVGTIARGRSICKLFQGMERNNQVAGVCGEIAVFKPDYSNPVEASQHFEYKMSHILDKSTESMFGYISVLPGAFSAYRYEAIKPGEDGTGPLVDYFKSITASMADLGPFKANMYLAEDRILCYEIIARADCNWVLGYVKNAIAETDVPETLVDLVKQRRRWLNGSFFAMLYAILNFNRFWGASSHSLGRKIFVTVQFVTYVLNIFLNWFLIGTFYIAFVLTIDAAFQTTIGKATKQSSTGQKCSYKGADGVAFTCETVYLLLTFIQLIVALGNKPQNIPAIYGLCTLFYGMFTLFTVVVICFLLGDSNNSAWKCEQTPQVISCNAKNSCVPGWVDYAQCGSKDAGAGKLPEVKCDTNPLNSWDCLCNEDQVGFQRFGDCQTLCADAPIHPETLRWCTVGTFGIYFGAAMIHGELYHIAFSIVQYYYMLPTFINCFSIYSFCNVHDISWGTKGIEAAHGGAEKASKKKAIKNDSDRPRGETAQREADSKAAVIKEQREESKAKFVAKQKDAIEASFQSFRSYLVIGWVATNALYFAIFINILRPSDDGTTVPAHFAICRTWSAMDMALTNGMGMKVGRFAPYPNSLLAVKSYSDALTVTETEPPCSAYGQDLEIGINDFLYKPRASSQCTDSSNAPPDAGYQCCITIDEQLAKTPPLVDSAQLYVIGLFSLIGYSLGLKLIGSVSYLVVRWYSNTYHKVMNNRRKNFEQRRADISYGDHEGLEMQGIKAQPLSRSAILAGWSAQFDPQTQRTYYQNTKTGQTSWEPPQLDEFQARDV